MTFGGGYLRFVRSLAPGVLVGLAPAAALAIDEVTRNDPSGDAVVRRTDSCNCGPIQPAQSLPDVRRVVISPWLATSPATDPYTGSSVPHADAHLLRIDVVFSGLVNPPGTLGLGGQPYNPMQFGLSPVFGFVEIDVDHDSDTGGDLPAVAATHYLGNAARFGGRPHGELAIRAAQASDDLYQTWTVPPQVCLSGADWVLALCGCFAADPIAKSNPSHATFQAGDSWILSGRYFQRTTAYQNASLMTGGTNYGLYDPVVTIRFEHSIAADETTVTLVYPLDPIGAGLLAGAPPEPIDLSAANQTSIAEGVQDLIDRAAAGGISDQLALQVTQRWASKTTADAVDTTRWRPSVLVGTSYFTQTDGLYIWTDLGFDCIQGDVNGDGLVNSADRSAVLAFIDQMDGGTNDADATVNDVVVIPNFAVGFSVFDVDGDGVVGSLDLGFYPIVTCPSDYNNDTRVNILDIFAFLNGWFAGNPNADFNHSGSLEVNDVFSFLNAWFAGC